MSKQATVIICLSKVNGGMELAAVKLARLLSRDVPTYFLARSGGFIASEKERLFSGYDVHFNEIGFSSNLGFALIFKSRRFLIENGIKNIIFLGASEMKSLYFATLGLDLKFIIRQGSRKSTPKKDWFHRLIYSNVNSFVGNCEFIKHNIKEIIPLAPQTQLTRIYASLQLQDRERPPKTTPRLELISVGRIHPVKGQLQSIQALSRLDNEGIDFRLRILGDAQDTDYYQQILSYVETLPYKEKIVFEGYTHDVASYLLTSDILLFPTMGEGMSNAVIEGLGYGTIPIIYNNTSSPEFKELGFHLHLVEDGNNEAFEETLLECAKNFSNEQHFIKRNMELARSVFSSYREKNDYLALLQ